MKKIITIIGRISEWSFLSLLSYLDYSYCNPVEYHSIVIQVYTQAMRDAVTK